MTRPDFLVIGAPRAGTSLLHRILQAHDEVYVPTQRKEIQFFDRYFDRGPAWYERYFPPSREASAYRAIGEASPGYLAAAEAPARIHALIPDCRLIAILRNPVDRAHSAYQYARRSYNERADFETFLRHHPAVMEAGLYGKHVGLYLALFSRESLLVLLFEELIGDPARELDRLRSFLTLSHGWDDPRGLLEQKVNPSDVPRFRAAFATARRVGGFLMRHDVNWPVRMAKRAGVRKAFGRSAPAPPVPAAMRARLAEFYRADVAELARLVRRDLRVWHLEPA